MLRFMALKCIKEGDVMSLLWTKEGDNIAGGGPERVHPA